jgi:hypothetical protein
MQTLTQTLTDSRTAAQIVADYERLGMIGLMRQQNSWVQHHPQYEVSAGIDALVMGAQFAGGFGPEDHHFGPDSAESKLMLHTPDFAYALSAYFRFHNPVVHPPFGAGGYWRSGSNAMAQFVGGFKVTFVVSGDVLFAQLENITSFGSLMADRKWAYRQNHNRKHWGGLMADTRQTYVIALRLR